MFFRYVWYLKCIVYRKKWKKIVKREKCEKYVKCHTELYGDPTSSFSTLIVEQVPPLLYMKLLALGVGSILKFVKSGNELPPGFRSVPELFSGNGIPR